MYHVCVYVFILHHHDDDDDLVRVVLKSLLVNK